MSCHLSILGFEWEERINVDQIEISNSFFQNEKKIEAFPSLSANVVFCNFYFIWRFCIQRCVTAKIKLLGYLRFFGCILVIPYRVLEVVKVCVLKVLHAFLKTKTKICLFKHLLPTFACLYQCFFTVVAHSSLKHQVYFRT